MKPFPVAISLDFYVFQYISTLINVLLYGSLSFLWESNYICVDLTANFFAYSGFFIPLSPKLAFKVIGKHMQYERYCVTLLDKNIVGVIWLPSTKTT